MKTFKDYLIDPEGVIEEARGLPPKMDYQFDEIDPDVDKNSFRDANKSRRNREADRRQREREDEDHRGFAYNTADGRDPRYHLTNSELAADREWEAEERFARGEEEEQKMPAYRERRKKVTPAYGNGTDYLSRASAKRRDQATNRTMRNSAGYDSVDDLVRNSEEEEQKLPAQRDSTPMLSRAMQNTANVYKKPNLDDKGMKHAAKRSGQSLGRVRRSVNGLRQEEEEQKSPGIRDKMTGFSSQLGQHMRIKNEKRARQNLDRFARRQTGSNHPRNSREEEEESRRSVPRGINYDFDDRKPQRGANRHKSLPAGKSARSNRVVNNSLYRPKTKDEFVKDKAHSAFKESISGDIFAAAFGIINEMDLPFRFRITFDNNGNKILKVSTDNGGFSVQTNGNLPQTHNMDSRNLDDEIVIDELDNYVQAYGTPRMQQIMQSVAEPDPEGAGADAPMDDGYGSAEADALDYQERNDPTGHFQRNGIS